MTRRGMEFLFCIIKDHSWTDQHGDIHTRKIIFQHIREFHIREGKLVRKHEGYDWRLCKVDYLGGYPEPLKKK